MAVIVKFFANFRETIGRKEERVESAKNVASILDELVRRFGPKLSEQLYYADTKELRNAVNIMVNGTGIKLPYGLDTPLKDGDVVAIFPPVSGG